MFHFHFPLEILSRVVSYLFINPDSSNFCYTIAWWYFTRQNKACLHFLMWPCSKMYIKKVFHMLAYQLLLATAILWSAEAATGGVLLKKVFLEILQNSQENTCARVSFLIKLQASSKEHLFYRTPLGDWF